MSISVLISKISVPPLRQKLVDRLPLIKKFNQAVENGFVLVSAPAGYGKTTLLSVWLDQITDNFAWLTLDPSENDLVLFLNYLAAALSTVDRSFGEVLKNSLRLNPQLDVQNIMTPLVNHIGSIGQTLYLVLDDYHVIQNDAVHQAVMFLIDHRIQSFRIIIASRTDPPFALSRYRAHAEMSEFRLDDLRFSSLEAEAFLTKILKLNLTKNDLDILENTTEGWVAGLQMIGLSLQNREDISSYIQSFSGENRYIIDFFFEEIFQRQTEEIQDFLVKSSILDRLCESLCDQVIMRKDSQTVLEHLEHRNLFLTTLDEQRKWFRYHPLFQILLKQQLRKKSPDILPELNLRASQWYEGNGNLPKAIVYAFESQDVHRAASLIERAADSTLLNGEINTFLTWVEKLPPDVTCQWPMLCVYHAEALILTGQSVEPIAHQLGNKPEAIVIKALQASYQGDVGLSRQLSRQALEKLSPKSLFLQSVITSALGAVLVLSGEVDPAIETFHSSANIARNCKNEMLEVIALCRLGQLNRLKGQVHQAEEFFQSALDLSTELSGDYFPLASMPLMTVADLKYELNEMSEAKSLILKAIALSGVTGGFWSVDCQLVYAWVLQAQGDSKNALAAMQKAFSLALKTKANPFDDIYTAAYLAKLQLAQGDINQAMAWARKTELYDVDHYQTDCVRHRYHPKLFHLVELELTTLARLLIAQEKTQKALDILNPLYHESKSRNRTLSMIENLLLQTRSFQTLSDVTKGLITLEAALELGMVSGVKRIFINEGTPLLGLMERLSLIFEKRQSSGEEHPRDLEQYLQDLILAFNTNTISFDEEEKNIGKKDPKASLPNIAKDLLILTHREEEVLKLIAQGLSNKEIAEELFIATGTVHKHLKNIYSKLNVHNRTAASACAREFGLLDLTNGKHSSELKNTPR